MAIAVLLEDWIEIPLLGSLREFRDWAVSERFPEQGRIDYIAGRIEVDLSPEDLFSHGTLKTEILGVLRNIVKHRGSGHLFSDRTLVSCPDADLSVEPDVLFVSDASLDSGVVRLVPKSGGQPDRYVELEGPPDLIAEIVSDSSLTKDTQRLPASYWRAGVREFWLIDGRGETLLFQIHHAGRSAYEPATPGPDGFQYSPVLNRSFQLTRNRNPRGRWVYDLVER